MFKSFFLLACLGILIAIYFKDIFLIIQYLSKQTEKADNLYTAEELAFFDGVQSPLLFLSILGNVFNVTKGAKHYGPGQQYHFFVGKDASRNFISGNFEDGQASDDVGGLKPHELKSLNNWLNFYKKEYKKVGKVIGRFYDNFGLITPYHKGIRRLIREAEKLEDQSKMEKQMFPPCNVEWSQEKGSRVWCTQRSGGIERAWAGKPRQYYEAGTKSFRCACISKENESLGNIKEYPGCDINSDECYVTL
ncbi:neuferricin homolog [Anthonomus grandis grandis]|uniref:neuferricin homolog n=1 Tax=Anthonomus grandis grandis TaxID=2921223 RepID=UPI002165918A|nr:neuferricin homolog [Anthonomus grandis grandis]